jgi:hypothetical protein
LHLWACAFIICTTSYPSPSTSEQNLFCPPVL